MNEALPLDQMLAAPVRRDRRIGIITAVSAGLHVVVIGALLLLPMLHRLQQPAESPPITVELVPPSDVSSLPPPPSSEPPSSESPPSAPPSSEQPSMELASSGASEPPSSTEAASAASNAPAQGSSAPAAASASQHAPVPMQRPVLIPLSPDEPSSEAPSTEGDASSLDPSATSEAPAASALPGEALALVTTDTRAAAIAAPSSASEDPAAASAEASSEPPPPPKIDGALHVAKTFYLANMLQGPAMASAREAIKKLPPQKRLVQTCNIEAIAQIGQGSRYRPDAIVADAFAPTQPAGTSFKATAGAFRSDKKWFTVSYDCMLSKDLSKVQSFSFRIGEEVTLPSHAPAQVRQGG